MAPFCSPCASTTWPRMAASARAPAGQKGRYRSAPGGTNDTPPLQPPDLTRRPDATQRIARGYEGPGRVDVRLAAVGSGCRGPGGPALSGRLRLAQCQVKEERH